MRYCFILLQLILLPPVLVSSLHGNIIHVPGDSTTIQGGINGAVSGDTVMVALGTYYEHDINFLGKSITVTGTDPLNPAVVLGTVVDADGQGRVFHFNNEETADAVLMGFTVRGGSEEYGAGIYCFDADPTISRNIVIGNTATEGGAGIYLRYSDALVADNIIMRNETASHRFGGGVYMQDGRPILRNNLIARNSAQRGAGVYSYWSVATLTGNTIVNNSTTLPDGQGGGIYCTDFTELLVTDTILWDNLPQQIYMNGYAFKESYWNSLRIRYSDIEGGLNGIRRSPEIDAISWEEGMLDEDPMFFDPEIGIYSLQQDPPQPGVLNPCVDGGDPASLVLLGSTRSDGVQDTGVVDMGFHYRLASGETAPPFAHYNIDPPFPDPEELILLDASASYDLDGEIVLYEWDWESDGVYDEITSEVTVTHSFLTFGYHLVTLRVVDDNDESHTVMEALPVFPRTVWVPDHVGSIQEAIEICDDGDSVMVRPGTYVENIDFLGRALTLRSKEGAEQTIIDGNRAGSVVKFVNNEGPESRIQGFTLTNGLSSGGGGGIYCSYSFPSIIDNIITGNEATANGGGITCGWAGGATITNNLIEGNSAGGLGGGVYCPYSVADLTNNTITGNSAVGGGAIAINRSSILTVLNSILWANVPDEIFIVDYGIATVSHSDVEGGWEGVENIDADPLFFNAGLGDYHLRQEPPQPGILNPCVDTGDPSSLLIVGSTRTDSLQDEGIVDMGYHYLRSGGNVFPYANLDWSPSYPNPEEIVLFDGSASFDLDGEIVLYEWDWDSDGIYDEAHMEPTATFFWNVMNHYPVTLRIWDEDNDFDTITGTIPVFPPVMYVPDHLATIQEAIEVTDDADSIIVREGTYVENLNFLGKAITVLSEAGAHLTIIDGNQAGSVVTFDSGERSGSVIQGFTLTNGYASHGGGVNCNRTSPRIANNIIVANQADIAGGGIKCEGGDPIIENNLIEENWAGTRGGGVQCNGADARIWNNTIAGNSSSSGGGVGYRNDSRASIKNGILWGNVPDQIYRSDTSSPDVSYSDIEGGWTTGTGNIDADPLFISFRGFDYVLGRGSPCIDMGDPTIEDGFNWPLIYDNSPRSDMGAYGGPGNVDWLP